MTSRQFYAVEINAYKPGVTTLSLGYAHGTHPHGTLSQTVDNLDTSGTLYASDMGYRTKSTDAGGVVSYPPVISEAFALSRAFALGPSDSGVAAAWGSVMLSNAGGRYDALAGTWNADGRAVKILYGSQVLEDFGGYKAGRTTSGTYFDSAGTLQSASAGVARWNYPPVPTGINLVQNSATWALTAGNGPILATFTAGYPDAVGGMTAGRLLDDLSVGTEHAYSLFVNTINPSTVYTFSADVKADTWDKVAVELRVAGAWSGGNQWNVADLTAGTISPSGTIKRLGNGWFRISVTGTTTAGSPAPVFRIGLNDPSAGLVYNGAGTRSAFFARPQIEQGSVSTAYVATGLASLLAEPTSTNYVRNPRAEGAATGTPGTSPTNWSPFVSAGGTTQITAIGTENGIAFVEYHVSGTLVSAGIFCLDFDAWNTCPAVLGDSTTFSTYSRLTAGAFPTGATVILQQFEFNSGGGALAQYNTAIATPTSGSLSTQRGVNVHAAIVSGSCVSVMGRYTVNIPGSVAFDFTVRVGGPQMEKRASATSLILPVPSSPAITTRDADSPYTARMLWADPSYASLSPAFVGVATPWFLSATQLQVPLRDATYWLERPLQANLYAGTGTYEGPATLTGQPKPKARGGTSSFPIRNVTPTLVDPTNRIYQYNDAAGTVVALYEGGNLAFTNGGDTTNLYVGSTSAGQYRTDNSRGLFQLGSVPARTITADVTGQFPVAGAQSSLFNIARYLLAEDLTLPSANLLASSFTTAASAYPYTAGVYFPTSAVVDGATALGMVLAGTGAKIYPARDGTLRVFILRNLSALATPVATFSTANTVSVTPRALPSSVNPPPFRFRVGYAHNYTVQTSDISPSATDTIRKFIGDADRFASWSSSAVLAAYRRPNDPAPLATVLGVQADASAVATDLGALFGTRRRLYDVVVPFSLGIVRDLGDVVSIVWPMDDLAGGKLGQIVGDSFRSEDSTITLQVLI